MVRRARPVSEDWLELARERRAAKELSLKDLGAEMARRIGRPKPYSVSAVNDVLWGRGYSADMVEALAEVLGLELPAVSTGDAAVLEWAELGTKWNRLDPDQFRQELSAVREMVSALEKYRNRR